MFIHTQSGNKNKSAKVVIEFANEQEKQKVCDYLSYLDSPCLHDIQKAGNYGAFGIDSNTFLEALETIPQNCASITGTQGEAFAVWWDILEIKTDPKRFQNRTNAFSELSAQQVAENYNENYLDPIVVWRDPNNQKIYVLSGHSRYEGMLRRNELHIPVRFFTGTEADAIKFARIDANRAANKENLIEDLNAYKLSRDGDVSKGIMPLDKKALKQAFKGKEGKLEAWSYLSQNGKFLQAMEKEDTLSQFPRIQTYATWVGKLRKEKPNITDLMESDMYNFFYHSDQKKLTFDKFRQKVLERLGYGKDRIFPECEEIPCKVIKDFKEVGQNREVYKELAKLNELIQQLADRQESNNPVLKVYTDDERKALQSVKKNILENIQRLQRDLGVLERAPGLFGAPHDMNKLLLEFALKAINLIE